MVQTTVLSEIMAFFIVFPSNMESVCYAINNELHI